MDPALNLILVSVFAGVYALWTHHQARRESARLDAEQGITGRPVDKPATRG